MSSEFSWADLISLLIAGASLAVTIAIFLLGRRLTFKQQRDREGELREKAWKVLGPIRTKGLNSKVIVMNVARYERGYNGENSMTWRGHVYTGAEIMEIVHGGVEVLLYASKSYYDADGRLTLTETPDPAPNVLEFGHIPWKWIEDINPDGDEFDGSAIFFVHHRAPGRQPYDFVNYREGTPVKIGPNQRDYYMPAPGLETRRPRPIVDRLRFIKELRQTRKAEAAAKRRWDAAGGSRT